MAKVLDKHLLDNQLRLSRRQRFACQSVARKALPEERVAKCLRMVNNQSQVEVWKHLTTEKVFYNGLLVCGSVWHCPVCASKISERRRLELKQAFEMQKAEGNYISMLTLTFSHSKFDKLNDLVKKLTAASSKFRTGKRYQKIRDGMNMNGSIRAFEITYGKNGFHPHLHIAIFYKNDVDLKEYEEKMYDLWEKACAKYGLITDRLHGLKLEDGNEANDYLSKYGTWSLDREMSKYHIKEGKEGSIKPFDFLKKYLETEQDLYLQLYKEYALALKGKTQLYWSRGLKKYFLIGDKSDEQVAKEKIEEASLLGFLNMDQWKYILKHDYRTRLLDLIENTDFNTAMKIIFTDENKKRELQTLLNLKEDYNSNSNVF